MVGGTNKLQRIVVVLLILSVVLSLASVAFNIVIFKMSSQNSEIIKRAVSSSSNAGNIGLFVEGNTKNLGGGNG